MNDSNQLIAPQAFVDLFIEPGRNRASESREFIFERYEFCDDLATLLTEHADKLHAELDLSRSAVLKQCYLGLLADGSSVTAREAPWVIGRLAELLEWRFQPEDLESQ